MLTADEAARAVSKYGGTSRPDLILKDAGEYREAYRAAASKLHPDAGGAAGDWQVLQAAKSLLDELHKR